MADVMLKDALIMVAASHKLGVFNDPEDKDIVELTDALKGIERSLVKTPGSLSSLMIM